MKTFATAIAGLLLTGCAATPTAEPRRLLLSYDGPAAVADTAKAVLVVRAVTVPDYLDRREIVRRDGVALVAYDDAVWAERPARAITRYLTQALDAARGDYRVQPLTSASGTAPEAALTLVIDRFEAEGSGPVQLRGHWSLTRPGKVIASGRLDADAEVAGGSAAATVAAMQQALGKASAALAASLPAP